MTAQSRNWWVLAMTFGVLFALLNLFELVALDGGTPEIVGVVLGIAVAVLAYAKQRGWKGVLR
jgi:hypothetical protein